jgi:Tfp pilus assembly protein PilF
VISRISTGLRLLLVGLTSGLLACAGDDTISATASVPELLAHAERRLQDGDLNSATASYRRALQKDSTSSTAMLGLGRVYEVRGRLDMADRYRRRAFQLDYRRGTEARALGDLPMARKAFAAASHSLPGHPLASLQIGETWLEESAGDSAIAYLEATVLADPRFVDARIQLGKAYLLAERTDEAQASFEAAIERNINAVDAYLHLGVIHAERGEWAHAAAHYDRALLIRPSSQTARQGLAQARARL